MPRPPPQVPQRALGQSGEVHRPVLELGSPDPGEGESEIDPEPDGDARRHDRVGRRLDLVA